MMQGWIRQLCTLSILCGAAQALAPKGSAKRALSFVCSVVLLCFVVFSVKDLDWESYAVETTLLRERELQLQEKSSELRDRLDRRVIEAEVRDYVLQEAKTQHLALSDAVVQVQWSTEGAWVPYSVKLYGKCEAAERARLGALLETELGIPLERQEWIENE